MYFFHICHTTSNSDTSNSSKRVNSFLFYTNNTKISLLGYSLSFLISIHVLAYSLFLFHPQTALLSLYLKPKSISYKFYDFYISSIRNKDQSLNFICTKSILFVSNYSNSSSRQVLQFVNLLWVT